MGHPLSPWRLTPSDGIQKGRRWETVSVWLLAAVRGDLAHSNTVQITEPLPSLHCVHKPSTSSHPYYVLCRVVSTVSVVCDKFGGASCGDYWAGQTPVTLRALSFVINECLVTGIHQQMASQSRVCRRARTRVSTRTRVWPTATQLRVSTPVRPPPVCARYAVRSIDLSKNEDKVQGIVSPRYTNVHPHRQRARVRGGGEPQLTGTSPVPHRRET